MLAAPPYLSLLGNPFERESLIAFAAMTAPPSSADKKRYNAIIRNLKGIYNSANAGTAWSTCDVLCIRAAHDLQTGLLNLKNPAAFNSTLVDGGTGAPLFTPYRGIATNGIDNLINSNYNPATAGGNLTQNSYSYGIWSRTNIASSAGAAGWDNGTTAIKIIPRSTVDVCSIRMNSGVAGTTFANTDSTGFYLGNRTGSAANTSNKNGTVGSTPNTTSAAHISHNLQEGSTLAGSFLAMEFALMWIGGALSASAKAALYNAALLPYMQEVGAA